MAQGPRRKPNTAVLRKEYGNKMATIFCYVQPSSETLPPAADGNKHRGLRLGNVKRVGPLETLHLMMLGLASFALQYVLSTMISDFVLLMGFLCGPLYISMCFLSFFFAYFFYLDLYLFLTHGFG